MGDLALNIVNGCIDLALTSDGSQLVRDDGLETAVLISLFTDRYLAESELPDGADSQRGWWGDEFLPITGDKIGSKIWAFSRAKINGETASALQVRAKQALNWMIQDGVASKIDVSTQVLATTINIIIKISRPANGSENLYSLYWDGQSLKR